MTIARFEDLQRAVFAYHSAGKFEEGLELLNENAHHHPRHAHSTIVWKAAFAALTDQPSIATWTLDEGLAAGYWWADEILIDDPDFASMRNNADFLVIVEECRARKAAAQTHAVPAMFLSGPSVSDPPWPALMVLHGSAWTAASFARRWAAARKAGWLLAVPQSSQMSGPEHYGWLKRDIAIPEVQAHASALIGNPRVDAARVVAGGFWSGAALALELVCDGLVQARGFIACGMVLDPSDPAIEAKAASLAKRGVAVALFGGRGDPFAAKGLEALASAVNDHGGRATVDVRDDLAHDFPPDFDDALPGALRFLTVGGG